MYRTLARYKIMEDFQGNWWYYGRLTCHCWQWVFSTACVSESLGDIGTRYSILGSTQLAITALAVRCGRASCNITAQLFFQEPSLLSQLGKLIFQFTQSITWGEFFGISITFSTTMLGNLWLCPCPGSAPVWADLFALPPSTPSIPSAVNG